MEREVPAELVSERHVCRDGFCTGHREPAQIIVRRVSVSQIRAGWSVGGAGRTSEQMGLCPHCGAVCQVILTQLPIELAGVHCPTCNLSTNYEYSLDCVETDDGEFSFTATVRCPGCSPKTFTGRIVDGLRRIKHLKLGPTGVEVDLE